MAASDPSATPSSTPHPPGAVTPDAPASDTPAATETVPLPAPPEPAPVEVLPPRLAWLDGSLVALLLLLAFLLASTPVTESDFFREAATGRLISKGRYSFGEDPFAFGMLGKYWVNHSWLFGWLVYKVYAFPAYGGTVLVVLKALFLTLLAWLMLRTACRPGQSSWLPVVATALAFLAMSPFLQLSSRCTSYLGLALVLWLLGRAGRQLNSLYVVPLVCLAWANLDAWFWLGPLAVACYLLGELVQRRPEGAASPPSRVLPLAGVLVASLVACLVNPHVWRVFQVPAELGPASLDSRLREEGLFRNFFLSPWQSEYFDPHTGLSVAGLAFFPLLGLWIAALVLGRSRTLLAQGLLGTLLALLGLWNSHLIPFFAIVAAPTIAQGFLGFLEERAPHWTPRWRQWALAGRGLTAVILLLLGVAVVPGWIHALPHGDHRVGWQVRGNTSLVKAAQKIDGWRDARRIEQDGHWLAFDPEVADYLAWYCPGEQAWFDRAMLTHPHLVDTYFQLRHELAPETPANGPVAAALTDPAAGEGGWQEQLRAHGVRFVILNGKAAQPLFYLQYRLLARTHEWAPCYMRGETIIFGWLDPPSVSSEKSGGSSRTPRSAGQETVEPLTLKIPRMAFSSGAITAPMHGLEQGPAPEPWWEELWHPEPPPSLDQGTALLQERRYQALSPAVRAQQDRQWQAMMPVSAVGAAAVNGPLAIGTLLALGASYAYRDHPLNAPIRPQDLQPVEQVTLQWRLLALQTLDEGPPSSLYLGIRYARSALATHPDDPLTHLLLARAYYQLGWHTREQYLGQSLPPRSLIRVTQLATALADVLRLQPSLSAQQEAHRMLAELYQSLGYLDLQVHHRSEEARCLRAQKRPPGVDEAQLSQYLQQLDKDLERLHDRLSRNQSHYQLQAARRPLPERLQMALKLGLLQTAYNELFEDLKEHKDTAPPGQKMELAQLMLHMGQVDDARQLLLNNDNEADEKFVVIAPWLYVQLALARGNYAEADRDLELREQSLQRGPDSLKLGVLVGSSLLNDAPLAAGMPWQLQRRIPLVNGVGPSDPLIVTALRIALESRQALAECRLFRGWIALEAGLIDQAREHFQHALDLLIPQEKWIPLINRIVVAPNQEMNLLRQVAGQQEAVRRLAHLYRDWLASSH